MPKSVYVIPDEQSITIINGKVAVKDGGITTSKYADRSLTRIKRALATPATYFNYKEISPGGTGTLVCQPPSGEFWKVTVAGYIYAPSGSVKIGLTDGTNKVYFASVSSSGRLICTYVPDLIITNSVYPFVEIYNGSTTTYIWGYILCSGHKITKGYAAIKVGSIPAKAETPFSLLSPASDEVVLVTHALSYMDTGSDSQRQIHYITYPAGWVGLKGISGTGLQRLELTNVLVAYPFKYMMYMCNDASSATYTAYTAICGEVVE